MPRTNFPGLHMDLLPFLRDEKNLKTFFTVVPSGLMVKNNRVKQGNLVFRVVSKMSVL